MSNVTVCLWVFYVKAASLGRDAGDNEVAES